MPLTLEQWSWIGTIASSIFSFLALGAIIFAWLQIRTSTEDAAAADANAIQRSLIEKSLELPQFVSPNPTSVNIDAEKFSGSEVEFRRYEIFVELVLTTFDHLASCYPDAPTRRYMIQVIAEHQKYLDSSYFRKEFWEQLSPAAQKLIEDGVDFAKERATCGQNVSTAA